MLFWNTFHIQFRPNSLDINFTNCIHNTHECLLVMSMLCNMSCSDYACDGACDFAGDGLAVTWSKPVYASLPRAKLRTIVDDKIS